MALPQVYVDVGFTASGTGNVFTGPVGSRMELQAWLSASIDDLRRRGQL
ncbi:hypothetical protein ACQPZX_29375 [Actinoplanes sp. CA-142083]